MIYLKPCPFCNKPMHDGNFFAADGYPMACGCWEKTHTSKEAVDVWNTRPIENVLNERIAELENENAQSHDIVNDISELNSENVKIIAQYIKRIAELNKKAEIRIKILENHIAELEAENLKFLIANSKSSAVLGIVYQTEVE